MDDKKSVNIDNVQKDGPPERKLLEEMNVPPAIIKFLRENSSKLQIAAVVIVIAIVAGSFYSKHTSKVRDVSAAYLASAMEEPAEEAKRTKLQEVVSKYSGTDAAVWSKLELAHLDFDAGVFGKAIEGYKAVLADLSSDSPIAPLVKFSIAKAYEGNGNDAEAMKFYQELTNINGFSDQAFIALGRMYEKQGNKQSAIDAYGKVSDIAPPWIKDRLASLKAMDKKGQPAPAE